MEGKEGVTKPTDGLDINHPNTHCSITFTVKKEGFGGGGTRILQFSLGQGEAAVTKSSGKTLQVSIGGGLPASTSK